jgi:hypothetical protein
MKRNSKPFSVEIKKSRVQGQRAPLPPRHLFATTPAEVPKVSQKDEPRVVPEPSATPRILPSIAEPMWSSSEPVETARRKRPSVEANREQMEFNLDASASEGLADAPAEARVSAEAMPQTDGALDDLRTPEMSIPFSPHTAAARRPNLGSHGRRVLELLNRR